MKRYLVIGMAGAFTCFAVHAADVVITPPAGGGFSVNTPSGTSVFRVDSATGGIFVPNLPSVLGSTPLCWNAATGLLSACQAGTGGTDATPPIISSNAPLVATQGRQTFTVTCSDNNELLYCDAPYTSVMAPGTKTFSSGPRSRYVSLSGQGIAETVFATDMSGNSAKLMIAISSPPVGIPMKKYKAITPNVVPAGFDCASEPQSVTRLDGGVVTEVVAGEGYAIGLGSPYEWTQSEGYVLGVSMTVNTGNFVNPNTPVTINVRMTSDGKIGVVGPEPGPLRIPLAATTALMPPNTVETSSSITYREKGYKGSVEYVAASDEFRISVTMVCRTGPTSFGPLTLTEGTPFILAARP